MPVGIERPRTGDPGHPPSRIERASGKRVLSRELVLMSALQKEIAVEAADDLQRAVEKRLLEAELHQHQQDCETDARTGTRQPALVRGKVAPRERNRVRTRAAGAGNGDRQGWPLPLTPRGQDTRAQNTSAGSARRRPPSANNAAIAAIASAVTSTATAWPGVMVTGSKVSWRIIR